MKGKSSFAIEILRERKKRDSYLTMYISMKKLKWVNFYDLFTSDCSHFSFEEIFNQKIYQKNALVIIDDVQLVFDNPDFKIFFGIWVNLAPDRS